MNKALLRQKIFADLAKISEIERQQAADQAVSFLQNQLAQEQFKIIALYMPMKKELSLLGIMPYLEKRGIKIVFPRIHETDRCLTFHEMHESETTKWGVVQPTEKCPILIPDMMICPFVGISKNRHRLGYGKGYYDYTIAQFHAKRHFPVLIGLGYQCQQIEFSFAEKHDIALHDVWLF